MKNLSKLLICAIVTIFALNANTAKAQQLTISPGLEIAVPLGDWGEFVNLGVGASAQVQYQINDRSAY